MDSVKQSLDYKLERLKKFNDACESYSILLDEILKDFSMQNVIEQLEFPATLSKKMRAHIHAQAKKFHMKTKSLNGAEGRALTISKTRATPNVEVIEFMLDRNTCNYLKNIKYNLNLNTHNEGSFKKPKVQYDTIGKLFQGSMLNIQQARSSPFHEFRRSLPVYSRRHQILDAILQHQVVIINAETGSGKTTQIPQFILEQATEYGQRIRVICTQPRRLSTVAVAERVAQERGEEIGQTVGYQIKLESRVGVRTALIYCTNGVLLRTLMCGEDALKQVSHVVVDEIHERDKYTDFLMICLRESLARYPHLRLILMSATMNVELYQRYFNQAQVLNIDGRSHKCHSLFLDDILKRINYENAEMRELRRLRELNGQGASVPKIFPATEGYANLNSESSGEINEVIEKCFGCNNDENGLANLMQMILNENINPNFQDSQGRTPLMAAAFNGDLVMVEQLLNMGATLFLTSEDGLTATGWAQRANHQNVVNILNFYQQPNADMVLHNSNEVSTVLADYNRSIGDDSERIDFDLIVEIIRYIHFEMAIEGAVLIFLRGYEDILMCHDKILLSDLKDEKTKIFMLHGSMQIKSQKGIFQRMSDVRKIVLSTNLAETSITIDDVRFVIDCGKAKTKSYDAVSGCASLKSEWISMANSRQRAGRAGRTAEGYCFHLYSFARYESFYVNPIPEILRVPLYELCLQSKLLAPKSMSIKHFLDLAIEPPSSMAVENSINVLMKLGALDENENLTVLGQQLVQLSLDPHLGKMLIYAAVFRCLDPVLTIVSSMAHKDAFNLTPQPHLKKVALERRRAFSEDTLSDHFGLLRAFQLWLEARVQHRSLKFCDSNFLSHATMELILMTRTQLLSQLRALGFAQNNQNESIGHLNNNSNQWALVKGCLAAGLYPNLAYTNQKRLHTRHEAKVSIVGTSCILKSDFARSNENSPIKDAWLVYDEMYKNNYVALIKSATVINPLTVVLMCGQTWTNEDDSLIIDDTYDLRFKNSDAVKLRHQIMNIVDKKINAPRVPLTTAEVEVIRNVANVLALEDESVNLPCPANVGQRPKITEYLPTLESTRHGNHSNYSYQNRRDERRYYSRNNFESEFQPEPSTSAAFRVKKGPPRNPDLFSLDALYFVIKPPEVKNIAIGMERSSWSFAPHTEKKLFHFFHQGSVIYLIFYAKNDPKEVHGVARLIGTNNGIPNKPCALNWISTNTIFLGTVRNFIHSKIHLNEDGQQLDGHIGQKLCTIIYENGNPKIGFKNNFNSSGNRF